MLLFFFSLLMVKFQNSLRSFAHRETFSAFFWHCPPPLCFSVRSHSTGGCPDGQWACWSCPNPCPSSSKPCRRGKKVCWSHQGGAVSSHPEGGARICGSIPPSHPSEPLQLISAAGQQLFGSLPPPRFVEYFFSNAADVLKSDKVLVQIFVQL